MAKQILIILSAMTSLFSCNKKEALKDRIVFVGHGVNSVAYSEGVNVSHKYDSLVRALPCWIEGQRYVGYAINVPSGRPITTGSNNIYIYNK